MAAIIILSAIAVPLISNLTGSSRLFVLRSNLHEMNSILREAYRAGSTISTDLDLTANEESGTSVSEICSAMTRSDGIFVDTDKDGKLDTHEMVLGMDIPTNDDPYEYLVGQHLFEDYKVQVHGNAPVQLAVFKNTTLHEIP